VKASGPLSLIILASHMKIDCSLDCFEKVAKSSLAAGPAVIQLVLLLTFMLNMTDSFNHLMGIFAVHMLHKTHL
jgi:hypothetical protein